jgi:hypothetical protein
VLINFGCVGTNHTILWGEVNKVSDELFWCNGGAKLPMKPTVNGTTDAPFFLVSLKGKIPNLNAIPLDITDGVNTTTVHCVYSRNVFQQCKTGIRRNPTELENVLKNFG